MEIQRQEKQANLKKNGTGTCPTRQVANEIRNVKIQIEKSGEMESTTAI
jgi:hypothetical protein